MYKNMVKIKEMFDEVHEIVGWVGMLMILTAYALSSFAYLSVDDVLYQLLNIVGAGCLVYSAIKTKSYPLAALNMIWLAIAGVSLFR